jgi:selenocysteine lyase/cysteine desulfurase
MIAGGTGVFSERDEMPEELPMRFEAGTAPLLSMYGLQVALRYLKTVGIDTIHAHEMALWRRLHDGLSAIPQLRIAGTNREDASVAIISFDAPGYDIGDIAYRLDHDYQIANRCGLLCAPLACRSLGVFPEGLLRLSIGYFNTTDDIDRAIDAVSHLLH